MVDAAGDAAVADIGMDRIGEVDRRTASRKTLDVALGCEDEDLVFEQVDAQRATDDPRSAAGRRAPRSGCGHDRPG